MQLYKWNYYQQALPLNWQGRSDGYPNAVRYHEAVHCIDLCKGLDIDKSRPHIGFVGYECDEGIIRNQGRPGAARGPKALRNALAALPIGPVGRTVFSDIGDIGCTQGRLEESQKELARAVGLLIRSGVHPILMGGGHEIAWAHYQGLVEAYPDKTIACLNFDAHFDLRPLQEDKGHSGTSFLQIANLCQAQGKRLDYTNIGLQPLSNTPALFETAKELKIQVIEAEELQLKGPEAYLSAIDAILERAEILMVGICMDVFASAFAPGVSAPQPAGLFPYHVAPLLRRLAASPKVVGLHVAELSPPFDYDGRTAQLAAYMISSYVRAKVMA